MNKEEAKMRVKLNINRLFLKGEISDIRSEYADKVNYAYVDKNADFYRMVGLVR